ncbi:phosphonate ABC transporter, permease protein PhnE [Caulobacter mirabilis]|uniref:Phosphonate ABC transporter, permease protein PhnE n=1 Tax=Caulobacter mirabilis TaxID=69666 RepID=A0A2D2B2P2_9CAUL|nr:phosphonate ABC transporter, permease protein PhnE [Caulobacter mirabilis]ATQ44532.1 phosphonate ABC transporter, permease protein PhnE [Caulobacter mirabilis]
MTTTVDSGAVPPPPSKSLSARLLDLLLWGGLAVALAAAFGPAEIGKLPKLLAGSESFNELGAALLNPDFTNWKFLVHKMVETVQIALWGTFIAVFVAVPLGLLAARNITPIWIQQPIRRVLDLIRAVPDLVIGLIFVIIVGLSPLAGVLALAFNTGGVLAKLFSEAVESIDKGPVEGVRATGAVPLQEIVWGVIPQVAPLWTSFALYRFESNARAATVLGLIGAGGIGQTLIESFNSFDYRTVSAIAIVVVITVSLIDLLSQAIRKRLL